MKISFDISASLRQFSGGQRLIEMSDAPTLADALAQLEDDHPRLYRRIVAPSGELYDFVGVFVNDQGLTDRRGDQAKLRDGDVVSILPAVAGG